MIAVIGLILGFLVSALFLIQGKRTRRRSNNVDQDKKRAHEPVDLKPKSYSKSEVALHNKRDDCWIIIKDKVYDVTSYVEEHPGGDAILDHAGDDSTLGFFGPQHATRVFDMIDDFYIGQLHKFCPRIMCLNEKSMEAHVASKKHAYLERLWKEENLSTDEEQVDDAEKPFQVKGNRRSQRKGKRSMK